MKLERKKALKIMLPAVFIIFAAGCGVFKQGAEQAKQAFDDKAENNSARRQSKNDEQIKQVFDQYVERVRWFRYWQGTTHPHYENENHFEDAYVEGKQISALFFWTKTSNRPKWGLCSSELSVCIANWSPGANARGFAHVLIDPRLTPQLAFASFAKANYGDGGLWFPPLSPADFEFKEESITLPPLGLPSSILHRVVPEEAPRAVEEIRQGYVRWTPLPPGCRCTLVFAYYSEAEPDWYVFRTCSAACPSELRGDSIQSLSRFGLEQGWTATAGGFFKNPEAVEWYKPRIEQAEMFRFEVP